MRFRIPRTACFGLSLTVIISIACNKFPPPWSDADLEYLLLNNKVSFDRLVVMAESDSHLARVAPTFYKIADNNTDAISDPSQALELERWNMYRDLFRRLRLDNGLMRIPEYPNVILMMPAGTDPHAKVGSKGIAFSRNPLEAKDNLDEPRYLKEANRSQSILFKHVTGNWYLFCLFYS